MKEIKTKKKSRPHKKVPSYWWDMGKNNSIIVESDDDRFPVVGRFKYEYTWQNHGFGCAMPAIEQAEKLIADLTAGRVTPKAC